MSGRILLPVKRFKQHLAECAVASASSICNYYDPSINYSIIRKMAEKIIGSHYRYEGLYTAEQAHLLNQIGFTTITIVSCDNIYDFSWNRLKKETLITRLKQAKRYQKRLYNNDIAECLNAMIKWLSDSQFKNKLIIDSHLTPYIKRHLSFGRPVIVSVNWTKLFKFSKGSWTTQMDIKGDVEDHCVVIRGYDGDGVFIVDSHHKFYTGKRARYKRGYYKLSWNKLCANLSGDIVLV